MSSTKLAVVIKVPVNTMMNAEYIGFLTKEYTPVVMSLPSFIESPILCIRTVQTHNAAPTIINNIPIMSVAVLQADTLPKPSLPL